MSEELKPCPLCKSHRIGGAIDAVTCWDCGLTLRRPRPLANAVAAWNTRPAPAPATCSYPDCNCPFDAPADPNWCARGLPKKAPATVATEAVAQESRKGILLEPAELRAMMEWAGIGDGYDEDDAAPLLLWVGEMMDEEGNVTYGLNARNEEVPDEGCWLVKELPRPEPSADKLEQAEDALRSLACWLSVGGYNSLSVDPAEFENRIRDGVNTIIEVETGRRIAALESQLAESEKKREATTSDWLRMGEKLGILQLQLGRAEKQLAESREREGRLRSLAADMCLASGYENARQAVIALNTELMRLNQADAALAAEKE